jgi:hypothetical protein
VAQFSTKADIADGGDFTEVKRRVFGMPGGNRRTNRVRQMRTGRNRGSDKQAAHALGRESFDLTIEGPLGNANSLGPFTRRNPKQDNRANLLIDSLFRRGEEEFELLPFLGGRRALAFGWSRHARILQLAHPACGGTQ